MINFKKRRDLKSFSPMDVIEKTFVMASKRWRYRTKLSEKVGKGLYALSMFEKLIRITKPMDNNHVLDITMEPYADYEFILDNISS